jgi:hypothetical protein
MEVGYQLVRLPLKKPLHVVRVVAALGAETSIRDAHLM